jgi:hypothetical protein
MTAPDSSAARVRRLVPLLAAAFLFLGLPVARAQGAGGIGGTGIEQETGGIGGTGIGEETGGIGGTGIHRAPGGIGGTGAPIVGFGPIQRFGSVFVNGREYRIDANTLVTIDGHPATVASLRVGDMALVQGVAIGAHGGFARSIATWQAIIGPVSRVTDGGHVITVLRQTVTLGASVRPPRLRPGQVVGVSAQRLANGNWVAHRVTALPPTRAFRLETTVSAIGAGHVTMGGLTLRADPAQLAGLHAGERVIATGTIINDRPVLTTLEPRPIRLGAPGTRVEVRNYFRSNGNGRLLAADGMEATERTGRQRLSGLYPVEVVGEITENGEIAATEVTPELPSLPQSEAPATKAGQSDSATKSSAAEVRTNEGPAGKPGAAHASGDVEPPEVGETPDTEGAEVEAPEIDVPSPQTPEPDIDAPEIEPPADQ